MDINIFVQVLNSSNSNSNRMDMIKNLYKNVNGLNTNMIITRIIPTMTSNSYRLDIIEYFKNWITTTSEIFECINSVNSNSYRLDVIQLFGNKLTAIHNVYKCIDIMDSNSYKQDVIEYFKICIETSEQIFTCIYKMDSDSYKLDIIQLFGNRLTSINNILKCISAVNSDSYKKDVVEYFNNFLDCTHIEKIINLISGSDYKLDIIRLIQKSRKSSEKYNTHLTLDRLINILSFVDDDSKYEIIKHYEVSFGEDSILLCLLGMTKFNVMLNILKIFNHIGFLKPIELICCVNLTSDDKIINDKNKFNMLQVLNGADDTNISSNYEGIIECFDTEKYRKKIISSFSLENVYNNFNNFIKVFKLLEDRTKYTFFNKKSNIQINEDGIKTMLGCFSQDKYKIKTFKLLLSSHFNVVTNIFAELINIHDSCSNKFINSYTEQLSLNNLQDMDDYELIEIIKSINSLDMIVYFLRKYHYHDIKNLLIKMNFDASKIEDINLGVKTRKPSKESSKELSEDLLEELSEDLLEELSEDLLEESSEESSSESESDIEDDIIEIKNPMVFDMDKNELNIQNGLTRQSYHSYFSMLGNGNIVK